MAALIRDATGRWTVAWLVLLTAQGLLPVATVYLTQILVDRLIAAVSAGAEWSTTRPVLWIVALAAGVAVAAELLRSVTTWVRTVQSERLKDHIQAQLHEKSVSVDLRFYDSADFHDRLHRARAEATYRPLALLESVGSLFQNGLTLTVMGAVLWSFGYWLPVALLMSTLPALIVVLGSTLREHDWLRHRTVDERRAWYYDWLLTSREAAAELRSFGLGGYFQSAYQALRQRLRKERIDLATRHCVTEAAAATVGLLVSGAALGWTVWNAMQGLVTVGQLALIYQAFSQGQRLMHSLLGELGRFYANSLFLGSLFDFLELTPQVVESKDPIRVAAPVPELRFRQVNFQYGGTDRLVLRNFDLVVPAGQVAAIVGLNGAGKSTMIKLLCRLYDPVSGRIELDGIDVRDLSMTEVRRLISVLLQEPVHYCGTVAENIRLGDVGASHDSRTVSAAARAVGAHECVGRLPLGYETVLGTQFDGGAELSVGEWHRIALARTFLRASPIIVLDEPTSAMDPWTEAEWLSRFRQAAAGRTAIVITHRLTTAMRADVVHVMANGRIVESGTHRELLTLGGLYARLWNGHPEAVAHSSTRLSADAALCQPA